SQRSARSTRTASWAPAADRHRDAKRAGRSALRPALFAYASDPFQRPRLERANHLVGERIALVGPAPGARRNRLLDRAAAADGAEQALGPHDDRRFATLLRHRDSALGHLLGAVP